MQEYIFSKILQVCYYSHFALLLFLISDRQLDETELASFDHLLQALRSGAPPHGGMALGIPQIVNHYYLSTDVESPA
jgi:aspartyl/asparaginyl-tRNA synthetase